jgi:hypothetical protein
MRTTTDLPVESEVTRTFVPNGKLRWAAVNRSRSKFSPLAVLFDAAGDEADGRIFAERCEDDRHHFRFIVSPDDAVELGACVPLPAS